MPLKTEAKAWWKGLSIEQQVEAVENWKKITKNEKKKTGVVLIASDDKLIELVYKELFKEKS